MENLQLNPIPAGIWQSITMDFVTDLPESRSADSMFVVVDRFSKAIVITPCRKAISAEETAQLYSTYTMSGDEQAFPDMLFQIEARSLPPKS